MRRKIGENAVIFLFLFGFISFCWTNRSVEPSAGEIQVMIATQPVAETTSVWESDYPASLLPDEKININLATAEDLERLPSIGAVRGAEIVSHRQEHGPFEAVENLLDVYGIGEATLAQVEPYITLD